jgi:hypothetical protein
MNPETVFQALLEMWPELPDLLGPDWPAVRGKVRLTLEKLRSTPDADQWFAPAAELMVILKDHPKTRVRLQAAISEVSRFRGATHRGRNELAVTSARQPSSGSLFARLRYLVRGACDELASLIRYTDISCPGEISVREPRLPVTVRLRVKRSEYTDGLPPVTTPPGPIGVEVDAPDFEVLGPRRQVTTILPNQDSPPLVFDLQPKLPGETRINFDFYSGTQPLGSATVRVKVTPERDPGKPTEVAGAHAVALLPCGEAPDYTMTIAYERRDDGPSLIFTLRRSGGVDRVFPPVPLGEEPLTRARRLFDQLTALSTGVVPGAKEVLGKRLPVPPEEVTRQLKEVGQNLWRSLVPSEFRSVYAAERAAWKDRTLFIFSDEPFFPWELLWPHQVADSEQRGDYWEDDQPWCLTLRLARWLRRKPEGEGHDTPPAILDIRALVCLAPTDSGLAAAQKELALLKKLADEHGWVDLSPPSPTLGAVKDLLEDGGFDWVHAAAHGSLAPVGGEEAFVLWLQGLMPLDPGAIVGRVAHNVQIHRAGFVFNACHSGRLGWSLHRLDGWAHRLIGSGAAVFLAPMWPVSDDRALNFAETFYAELLAGRPIAEAVRQGRLAARRDGDPSWLAYSLYAHPNARLSPAEPCGVLPG